MSNPARVLRTFILSAALTVSAVGGLAEPITSPRKPSNSSLGASPSILPSPGEQQLPPEIFDQVSRQALASSSMDSLTQYTLTIKRRLDAEPDDPYLLHTLGTLLWHQGAVREPLALWGAANKREPNLAPAGLMAAVHEVYALLAKGERAAAQSKLAAAEKRYAREPHFLLIRAEQAMRGNDLDAAEAAYLRAYELAPRLYVTSLNLARFYDHSGRDAAAARRLFQTAAELAPARPEVWANLAAFQFHQRQPEAALQSLRKARSLDAEAPLPERRLAELSMAAQDPEAAHKWYRAALETSPPSREAQAIRVALGDVLMRLGRNDEARREMEAVLEHEEMPALVFALATLDEADGRTDAARARYRRILQLVPGHPLAANNMAMLLIKAGDASPEALALAQQARSAMPNNAIVLSTYGCALALSGKSAESVQVLEPVVSAAPDDAWARYCLGRSLVADKRASEARPHLAEVLRLEPAFPRRAEVEGLLGASR